MPQEISWDMNNAKVVSKLGEPSKKTPRGGTIPICRLRELRSSN